MELNGDLGEYQGEVMVAMLATVLHQPPSVIRQQTYRDMEAVLLIKQVESKQMEEGTSKGGHEIEWQKTS